VVKILVDVEEHRSPVPTCLVALGVEVECARLPVGDYLVARDVAVERKTVVDLHRSVTSGRLWSQLHALAHGSQRSYLLVEGRTLDGRRVSARGIRGVLLQVAECGVSVVRSMDAKETALWLDLIARRQQRDIAEVRPRRRGRRRNGRLTHGTTVDRPGSQPDNGAPTP
jgi:ERCC4-type nuclease